MKRVKWISDGFIIVMLLTACLIWGEQLGEASEMTVDVGIEFTEIEPKGPSSSSKKPLVKLPQTGERSRKSSVLIGGSLLLGASGLIWSKRREVAEK